MSKIRQFEFDNESWKRLVEFMQIESAHCKYRLAEVVKASEGGGLFLDQAEYYQGYYIQHDTHVNLLKKDLHSFGKLLEREKFEDGALLKHVYSVHRRLREEINKLEEEFCKTKKRFGDFLNANT